jgi:TRAP-type C4-dicarboxylate transport system permease large subunit
VHFAVMFVLNVCVGIVHPPIRSHILITCSITQCPIAHYTHEVLLFLIALLLLPILVTCVPAVTLT